MTLPDEAVTLTGGCSCGAIRYRISVPETSSRATTPFAPPGLGPQMPYGVLCHCNDCRRATASLLPVAVAQLPMSYVTVSVLDDQSPKEDNDNDNGSLFRSGRILDVLSPDFDLAAADAQRPPYLPGADLLRAVSDNSTGVRGTWLRFWHSISCGQHFSRSFCGRCGTQVGFHFRLEPEYCYTGTLPEFGADLYDVNMGTLDREFLEKEWVEVGSQVQFRHGTSFGKRVAVTALGLRDLSKSQGLGEEEGMVGEDEIQQLVGKASG